MARRVQIRANEIAASIVDGEALIINLSTGVYYSLQGSAAFVWALLERGHDVDAVTAALRDRYGIDDARARSDVDELVAGLVDEEIVVDTGPGPAHELEVVFPNPGSYEPPAIERYSDMEDLLALDPPMPGITNLPWASGNPSRPEP